MEPVDNLLLCVWGDIKTAKTTLALSFPTPIFHIDLDFSFRRAIPRFEDQYSVLALSDDKPVTEALLGSADIITKQYQLPIKLSRGAVKGSLNLWEKQLVPDFITAVTSSNIKSIIVDTGSVMWKLDTDAQLDRVQQAASKNNRTRENLIQIEYSQPNMEMRGLIGAVRTYGKNLCMTHHIGGIYQDHLTAQGKESIRVGDTWDGFNHLGALVDVVIKTSIDKTTPGSIIPVGDIETCGYSLEAEGIKLPYPSYTSLLGLINGLRNGNGNNSS